MAKKIKEPKKNTIHLNDVNNTIIVTKKSKEEFMELYNSRLIPINKNNEINDDMVCC